MATELGFVPRRCAYICAGVDMGPAVYSRGAIFGRRSCHPCSSMARLLFIVARSKSLPLQAIYDPSNFYLVHLDRKSGEDARLNLENFIKKWDNVR